MNPNPKKENLKPYKKGETGNPNGRPKKLPELDKLLADVLGGEEGATEAELILKAIRTKAKKGDVRAAELILNRAYGKPKETVDLTTKDETKRVITLPGGIRIET